MADPIRPIIPLSPAQVAQLQTVTFNGKQNFAAGYKYIYDSHQDQPKLRRENEVLIRRGAPLINANRGGFRRVYTDVHVCRIAYRQTSAQ